MANLHPLLAPWQLPRWYLNWSSTRQDWRPFTPRRLRRLVHHALRRAAAWDKACPLGDGYQLRLVSEAMHWRCIALRSAWMVHVMRGARLEP